MRSLLVLLFASLAHGQTCAHTTISVPVGAVFVYQNGSLLDPAADYTSSKNKIGYRTISPNLFSVGDKIQAMFSHQLVLSFPFNGTTVTYTAYAIWQESWACSSGNRPPAAPPAWFPTLATFATPPASPAPGQAFLFTDASGVASCAGGGIYSQPCYWTGTGWAPVFPVDPSIFSTPPTSLSGIQCKSGLVDVTAVNSNGPVNSWEVPIIPSMDGSTRYDHVLVSEHIRFLGLPDLGVSMGRPGTNDIEMTGVLEPLEVSDADAAPMTARPIPPQITGGYPVVVNFKSSGGTLDGLTQGSLYWEVCGYHVVPPPVSSQLASLQTCMGSGGTTPNAWDCAGVYAATIRRPDGSVLPIVGPSISVSSAGVVWSPIK